MHRIISHYSAANIVCLKARMLGQYFTISATSAVYSISRSSTVIEIGANRKRVQLLISH